MDEFEPIKDYLGDGLYAEFDGWQIKLYAERFSGDVVRGSLVRHEVFVDPHVWKNLLAFAERVWKP